MMAEWVKNPQRHYVPARLFFDRKADLLEGDAGVEWYPEVEEDSGNR